MGLLVLNNVRMLLVDGQAAQAGGSTHTVLEDDLPLPLPLLPALPLVCQGGGGDLYGKGITRLKPCAMPGGRKVARF